MHKNLNSLVEEKRKSLSSDLLSLLKMCEYLKSFNSGVDKLNLDSCDVELLLNDGNLNSSLLIYYVSGSKLSFLNFDKNHYHPFFVKGGLTFCTLRFVITIDKLIFNVDINVLIKKFMESNIGEQDFISEMRNMVQEQLELKLASNDFNLEE